MNNKKICLTSWLVVDNYGEVHSTFLGKLKAICHQSLKCQTKIELFLWWCKVQISKNIQFWDIYRRTALFVPETINEFVYLLQWVLTRFGCIFFKMHQPFWKNLALERPPHVSTPLGGFRKQIFCRSWTFLYTFFAFFVICTYQSLICMWNRFLKIIHRK